MREEEEEEIAMDITEDELVNEESLYLIFQKRVRVFHRGFQHEKTEG